jgi:UDP-GlcNAc:undecaprenyl-phosphate/decaprenyl-phosphate GlcNAc-1-phosphate transferase
MIIFYFTTLIISSIFYLIIQKYFIKKGIYDKVKDRSSHNVRATRSGGASIFTSLFIITIYLYITSNQIFDFSLIIPLGILFTVGLYDDIYQVDFKLKFIFQLIVAKILIDQGLLIDNFNGFLGIYEIPYLISQLFTIIVIVFIINATNFTDGVDGLATTETIKCLIIVLAFSTWSLFENYSNLFVLILISLLPLYFYNFKKNNKVFLGDSGSLILGGIVCVAIISLTNISGNGLKSLVSTPLLILLCFPYPIVDSTYVIIKRIINKKSPFIADKSHIHHLILKKGYSHSKCLLIISGITGLIQLLTLLYITS